MAHPVLSIGIAVLVGGTVGVFIAHGTGKLGRGSSVASNVLDVLRYGSKGDVNSKSAHGAVGSRIFNGSELARSSVKHTCSPFPHGRRMECGEGVRLCGVLTLETGEDRAGYYAHPRPGVHGLWPQVGGYGDSECGKPKSMASPASLSACYLPQAGSDETLSHQQSFARHEWQKHGVCAGVANASAFFSQVCDLAAGPLKIMQAARDENVALHAVAQRLQDAGYCVHQTYSHHQVELSCCAGSDGVWKLADVAEFPKVCRWEEPDLGGASGKTEGASGKTEGGPQNLIREASPFHITV